MLELSGKQDFRDGPRRQHLANRTQAALYELKEGLALLEDVPAMMDDP
jgi:hypothetical protein